VHGLRQIAFGNGTVTAFAHDRRGRIEGIATAARQGQSAPTPVYAQRLQYDAGGRIVAIHRDGKEERYQYDGFDRLVQADTPIESRRFAYDAVGNRTAVWEPPPQPTASHTGLQTPPPRQTLSYQPKSNRLVEMRYGATAAAATSGVTRHDDANGSPVAIGSRRYLHGVTGRLVEVSEAGKPLGRYRYNVDGERIAKATDEGATYFLYANNKLVAEADARGHIVKRYLYLGHTPLAMIETQRTPMSDRGWQNAQPFFWQRLLQPAITALTGRGEPPSSVASVRTTFLHADHLGTPRIATDVQQRLVWRASYEAFGSAAVKEDPDGDGHRTRINLRLPGQFFDSETGRHYNLLRDYDPSIGRYVESDPIGLHGGINTYAYVGGDPLNYIDPDGLCPCGNVVDLIQMARGDRRDWSYGADRSDANSGFGPNTYKCNLFVDEQYESVGYNLPNIGGGALSRARGRYPPGAQSLSNPNYSVPGWPIVSGSAQPGDLVADRGHVGIVTGAGRTISASPNGVVENNWGFRPGQTPIVRRCTCLQ
jgi:RHS repeat-associated protein